MCLLFARKFLLTFYAAIDKQQPSPSTQRELNSSSIEPSLKRGGRNQLWHHFRSLAHVAKVAWYDDTASILQMIASDVDQRNCTARESQESVYGIPSGFWQRI
jgi:hypothetical protein